MLSQSRILLRGQSAYPHEQEALQFIRTELPDRDPYHLWELVELVDPSSGRLYELDALILGYQALYVVEIKSGPGRYEGDTVDWYRTPPGGRAGYMEPPLKLTNHKCKVLKSLIEARLPQGIRCPWLQPLVLLSHPEIELRFRNFGDQCVLKRSDFVTAVTHHTFPGAEGQFAHQPLSAPQAKAVVQALTAIGVRPSQGHARVGSYELEAVIEEGPGYEDRRAVHVENPILRRRARIYLVPQQTSVERRQQLKRAAEREVTLLESVKDHPNVLRLVDYEPTAPLGPTVLFDDFPGEPLGAFIRQHPELTFDERFELVSQIARGLGHLHNKQVLHGGLCPNAVLVSRTDAQRLEVRLYNLQLGRGNLVSSTRHWSELADAQRAIYQAPELRENPGDRSPVADVFSLGAVAYFVFTGRAPAESELEVDQRLLRDHHLDPRAIDDGVPDAVAEAICFATAHSRINRADDVAEWMTLLEETITAPPPPVAAPEPSPLEAKKGDVLGGNLTVRRLLGQGASARVLEVERSSDGRPYALKVALTPDDDARLAEEGAILGSLQHQRIVTFIERRELSGRTCLLMHLAGEHTLARALTREGPVSLDYASRYGEDLLSALEELEENQILHRDIKPANLGVGTVGKTKQHLRLFDFSLALRLTSEQPHPSRTHLGLGTAVYRDPYLVLRRAWDHAADRWSAAVTLHEMLCAARPSFKPEGTSALDSAAELAIAAERFDASVREALVRFFRRALHRDVEARFSSAAEMRKAWLAACQAPALRSDPPAKKEATPKPPVVTGAAPTGEASIGEGATGAVATGEVSTGEVATGEVPTGEAPEVEVLPDDLLTEERLRAIAPTTPIEALPLSARARNALDRAGLLVAQDLLRLPENRLSAVHGVGTQVARDILRFRELWQRVVELNPEAPQPFFAGYRGDELPLTRTALAPALTAVLADAGLEQLALVAAADRRQIATLLEKAGAEPAELTKLLEAENRKANQRERPTTLEGFVEALLPGDGKSIKNLKALFGLAEPFLGEPEVPVARVAKALGVTSANLYTQLGKAKDRWLGHAAVPELRATVHAIVDAAGGAIPIARAAEALAAVIPPDGSSSQPAAVASALLRMVGLLEREDPAGLRWERLDEGNAWLLARHELVAPLLALGNAADELALREPLASPGEAARVLTEAVTGTPFETLPAERLTELGAWASQNAARSTRLELYPRGLPAARALELSSSVLTGELRPDDIQQRVRARYPEAAPLPPRPELDTLLEPFRLRWEPVKGCFVRPGDRRATQHTSQPTSFTSLASISTAKRALDPRYVKVSEFEDQLRGTVQQGKLRVLGVRADRAHEAVPLLAAAFGFRAVSLDDELLAAIHRLAKRDEVSLELIHAADSEDRGGEDWPLLRSLVEEAAAEVAKELFPPREPLLLYQPGLLDRFELTDFLRAMVAASREARAASLCLLVPAHDGTDVPRINDRLVIPELTAPACLWIPPEWLKERSAA